MPDDDPEEDDRRERDDEFGRSDESFLDDDPSDEFPAGEQDDPSSELSPADVTPDPASTGDLPGDDSDDTGGDSGDSGTGDPEGSAPLSDLRADVEERRETEADDDLAEFFTEMDVGGVDEDTVWEELSTAAETPSVGPDAAVPGDDDVQDTRAVTVVEKRLCHGCPHFSDPPETACTHDGTTIEAEVDIDHFRVVDCPIVAEREEIEEMETSDF